MASQTLPFIKIGLETIDGPWLENRINEILNDAGIDEDKVTSEQVTTIAFGLIQKLHDLDNFEPFEKPASNATEILVSYLCETCGDRMDADEWTILGGTCDNCHCA